MVTARREQKPKICLENRAFSASCCQKGFFDGRYEIDIKIRALFV